MSAPKQDITLLLDRVRQGDRLAQDQLASIVYRELHRLASIRMRKERVDHTLQPTALVNEAFLRLTQIQNVDWESRGHFFGVAAHVMRQVLVNHARAHLTEKRGGGAAKVPLDEALVYSADRASEILAVDEALERLSAGDPRLGKVVELRFFAGLTFEETAKVLKVSEKTVKRDWLVARAWLHSELSK